MGEKYLSMTFYRSYRDALRTLPEALRVKLYDAILDYALDGIEPELDNTVAGMFMLIKPNIDNSQKLRNSPGRPKTEQEEKPTKKVAKRYGKGIEKVGKTYDKPTENLPKSTPKPTENLGKTEREREIESEIESENEIEIESDSHNVMAEDKGEVESLECFVLGGQEAAKENQKESKRTYGEFKNVRLSMEEARKLATKFPTDWQERIEALSIHKQSTGRKYKDDYATILNWDRYDRQKEKSKEQLVVKPNSAEGMKRSMDMMKEWLEQSELEDKEKEDTEE